MSNVFVIIKICYVHNQWYDISCATLYLCDHIKWYLFFQIYYDEDKVATLIIREVFHEDAGRFTCVAKNTAGFASSTTELIVEVPLSDHGSDTTVSVSRKSLSR